MLCECPKSSFDSLFGINSCSGFSRFDVAMGQKSYFKAMETDTYIKRNTFPQIPGVELQNPKVMVTERGSKLLLGGLWGYLRKPSERRPPSVLR